MYHINSSSILAMCLTPLLDESKQRISEYIVEVSLNKAPVPIVRRLSVPSILYVGHFAYLLVYAMGWDGSHLTEITQGSTIWRSTKELAMDRESGIEYKDMKVRNSFRTTMSQLLKKVGDECTLLYDMGDSWEHTIKLVEVRHYKLQDLKFQNYYPEIISGEGACPPDDCGGVEGYKEILRIIKDPEDYEYERFRSLLGEDFDPHHFDIRHARQRLYDYKRTIAEAINGFFER